jgi:hypothetical protein
MEKSLGHKQYVKVFEGPVAGTESGAQEHKGRDSCGGVAARGEYSNPSEPNNPGNRPLFLEMATITCEPCAPVHRMPPQEYEFKLTMWVDTLGFADLTHRGGKE